MDGQMGIFILVSWSVSLFYRKSYSYQKVYLIKSKTYTSFSSTKFNLLLKANLSLN